MYLFIGLFNSNTLINITVNAPELTKRLFFIYSPWTEVRVTLKTEYKITITAIEIVYKHSEQ